MAQKMVEFYDKAKQLGGFKAQMRLALLTGITSQAATSQPDTPDALKKFENAMNELRKEFK